MTSEEVVAKIARLVRVPKWWNEGCTECVRCHGWMCFPDGLDPTPHCNTCAQDIVQKAQAVLAKAKKRRAGK